MRQKSTAVTTLGYLLFVVIFFLATDIVLSIPLHEMYRIKEIETSQYTELTRKYDARIESFNNNQDILFTVEFHGYAFIQTEQDNSDKVIKLIFASDENRYEVDTEVVERFNLRNLFKKQEVNGINHGFITRFSPLQMKNGIYKLYIYCYENEDTIGFMDTDMIFEKTYRSFTVVKETSALDP